jgi:hypothetical protein
VTDLVHVSSKAIQDYTTPPELVQFLERRFGVDLVLDLAASPENARCLRYITKEQDEAAGGIDWAAHLEGVELDLVVPRNRAAGWLNPEFKKAAHFMERAKLAADKGAKIITLTLSSLGTDWYEEWVKPYALSLILKERVQFVGQPAAYPKELMVSLFGFGMTGLGWLRWKEEAYKYYAAPALPRLVSDAEFEEMAITLTATRGNLSAEGVSGGDLVADSKDGEHFDAGLAAKLEDEFEAIMNVDHEDLESDPYAVMEAAAPELKSWANGSHLPMPDGLED